MKRNPLGRVLICCPEYGTRILFDSNGVLREGVKRSVMTNDVDRMYTVSDSLAIEQTTHIVFPSEWSEDDVMVALHLAKVAYDQGCERGAAKVQWDVKNALGIE